MSKDLERSFFLEICIPVGFFFDIACITIDFCLFGISCSDFYFVDDFLPSVYLLLLFQKIFERGKKKHTVYPDSFFFADFFLSDVLFYGNGSVRYGSASFSLVRGLGASGLDKKTKNSAVVYEKYRFPQEHLEKMYRKES